jgi:hypothetical protein
MICTTYFLTFFSELIPPTGYKGLLYLFWLTEIRIASFCKKQIIYRIEVKSVNVNK